MLFSPVIGIGLLLGIVAILVPYGIFIVGTWRREHRLPGRLARELQKRRELEPFLEADENLAWEGRPVGFTRPPATHWVSYAMLVAIMLVAPAGIAALSLSRTKTRTWKLSLTNLTITGTGSANVPIGGSASAVLVSSTVSLPSPFLLAGFVAVLVAWEELRRFAGWRSRRYGITDRRVLKLDPWEKTFLEISRPEVESVRIERNVLVVAGGGREIRFDGIEDPEAARSALDVKENP